MWIFESLRIIRYFYQTLIVRGQLKYFVVIVYISRIVVNAYFSLFAMLCKQITINDDWVDEWLDMVLHKITKLRYLKIALYVKE